MRGRLLRRNAVTLAIALAAAVCAGLLQIVDSMAAYHAGYLSIERLSKLMGMPF